MEEDFMVGSYNRNMPHSIELYEVIYSKVGERRQINYRRLGTSCSRDLICGVTALDNRDASFGDAFESSAHTNIEYLLR
jgi:hypothetical protein